MKSLRNPFIRQWILFNYLGWLVGLLVGFLLYMVFIAPHDFLPYHWQEPPLYKVLEVIFLSIPLGISIGTMQGLVIRRWKFPFSSWTIISILGSVLAAIINIWLYHNGILVNDLSDFFLAPVFVGFIVALFQAFFFRKSISKPVLWVFSHILGYFVALFISTVIYVLAFLFADPIIEVLMALQLSSVVWSRDLVLLIFIFITFPIWLAVITGSLTGNILYKAYGNTQTG